MTNSDKPTERPARRKSDVTLLGKSSQDLGDKVYTLEFGVNLSELTLEGLNNYSVGITRQDKQSKKSEKSESLATALVVSLRGDRHTMHIEGGPPIVFITTEQTLDLTLIELEQSVIDAVNKGMEWLKGTLDEDDWVQDNRRHVPLDLITDKIATNLLMSSISTLIAGSVACHKKIMHEKQSFFSSRNDYIGAMFEGLRDELDEFTEVAINRGVQNYVANS
jgi:hypothetical protein